MYYLVRRLCDAAVIASAVLPVASRRCGAQQIRARQADLSEPKTWTAADDHLDMMRQLGITTLRPGPSGNEQDPNHANYDEAVANPFAVLPEALRFRNGRPVTSAREWPKRRAEIVEDFEREVYGRVPPNVPTVTWSATTGDYLKEKMPPVNAGLLDGQLAWRQHDGGHTDAPNWKYFLQWTDRFFGRAHTPAQGVPRADVPAPRTDSNSMLAHRQLLEKRTKGRIDVYFAGNSITRRWGATDYPELLANWKANFFGWNAADFGWGADRIQNMLWRLENGELDGVNPKVIVILAGTNNVGTEPGGEEKIADIVRGLRALVDLCRRKAPNATIILTGIFPRNDNIAVVPEINRINAELARFADGRTIRYININDRLADRDGHLFEGMMGDKLHPTVKGYQIWADALKPLLTELLGPPAATDQAPPPTGDPSVRTPAPRAP